MYRCAVALFAAALSVLVASGSASALIVSPASGYVSGASNVTYTLPSSGEVVTCASESKVMTFTRDGTGAVALGNARFSGCSSPLLGSAGVTQTAAWSFRTTLLAGPPLGLSLDVAIPSSGIEFVFAGCTFAIGGSYTKLQAIGTPPATIGPTLPVTASSLTITSASGPLCGSIATVGLTVEYRAELGLAGGPQIGEFSTTAGSYGGSESPASFRIPGGPFSCPTANKTFTLDEFGRGTVAAGRFVAARCATAIASGISIGQPLAWTVKVLLLSNPGVAFEFTVPSGGLTVSFPGCSFSLGGRFTKLAAVSSMPALVTGLTIVSSSLTIVSSTGCGPAAPVGATMSYAATLTFSTPIRVG
jgi:hypothetical protein